METKIYLVRHGETNWNKERRFQGQMDIPLNHLGEMQAKKLSERLFSRHITIDAIYSSDLKRAKMTAEFIASLYQLKVKTDVGLRERGFGKLEGLKIEDIKDTFPNIRLENIDQYPDFKAERFEDFQSRMYHSILKIARNHINNSIVIVSHGAAINSVLHEISRGNVGSGKTKIDNTSVTTIIYHHKLNKWKIEEINDITHMKAM